jgi:hypothetical protein
VKHCDAEDGKFSDVREFAYSNMHEMNGMSSSAGKKPMQDWSNDATGMLAGKIMGGKR